MKHGFVALNNRIARGSFRQPRTRQEPAFCACPLLQQKPQQVPRMASDRPRWLLGHPWCVPGPQNRQKSTRAKIRFIFGPVARFCADCKRNDAIWLRVEKVRGIFVSAPEGADTRHLPDSAGGFEGLQLVPSQYSMHQCYITENFYEQGSSVHPFQASQLALGSTAATSHCTGHFATGCLKLGGHLQHLVLNPPTPILDDLIQPFGHAVVQTC